MAIKALVHSPIMKYVVILQIFNIFLILEKTSNIVIHIFIENWNYLYDNRTFFSIMPSPMGIWSVHPFSVSP